MKKTVTIIGGGPAAMIAAVFLDPMKYNVNIYEKGKALGRKFLVAGKGGFNLTHSNAIEEMLEQYWPAGYMDECLEEFNNTDLRNWLKSIGINTYVGSSGRVFPEKGVKPIEVLNAIIEKLDEQGVNMRYNHHWTGWNKHNDDTFEDGLVVRSDHTIYAMGGASWAVTGSDGKWQSAFAANGIKVNPFEPSNCAVSIPWEQSFIDAYGGQPLKNIALKCNDHIARGELVITKYGLEGNALYAVGGAIRTSLTLNGVATINLDAKPTLSIDEIKNKLSQSKSGNMGQALKSLLKLPKSIVDLIKSSLTKDQYTDVIFLSKYIKSIPLKVTALAPIDEAISTVGGVDCDELDDNFELLKLPEHYCIGEMVDWDTITGGYLLQGSFSMGVHVARHINSQFKQFFES